MSKSYNGISLNPQSDPHVRSALSVIDVYLRDLSRNLSANEAGSVASGTSSALDAPYLTVTADATLTSERRLTMSGPLTLTDAGPNATATITLNYSAPTITLGTAAVEGVGANPIRSDATIAAFDLTVPASLAAAAATGSVAFAARRDHVHIFPTTLQSTGTVATLALTAAATTSTLTSSLATLVVTGATRIDLGATTNTVDIGASLKRLKKLWVNSIDMGATGVLTVNGSNAHSIAGTLTCTDVTVNGVFQAISGVAGDWVSSTSGGGSLGAFTSEWTAVVLLDTSAAFGVKTQFTSAPVLTANRTLTIDMSNADRTLDLTGSAILNQDVSTAGSPEFVAVNLNDSASAFRIALQATGTAMSADRALTLDIGNAARTLTISGNPTIADWFDQSVKTTADAKFNTAAILDNATSFYLKFASNSAAPGGNFSADRTMTIDMQNADRALVISGDSHISQNYSTVGTPQFGRIGIGAAAHATVLLSVNDAVSAPSTNVIGAAVNRYGGDTNYCGDPNAWLQVRVGASTYKIPLF